MTDHIKSAVASHGRPIQSTMGAAGIRGRIRRLGNHPVSLLQRGAVYLAALLTGGGVIFLIGYILITGVPHLKPELFSWRWTTKNQSMMPAIVNTLLMTALSLLLAVPAGIGGAVYMTEYAKRGSRLVKLVRMTAQTLQGIPSIVYGIFGFVFFGIALGWGFSLLSGAVTLAIMILPLILRATEEALLAVPDAYRESSFGLGAGRLRTVFRVILPSALRGILAGVVLAIGRIVGESAALIYTAGTGTGNLRFQRDGGFHVFGPLFQSTRTLSVHMYCLMSEGLHTDEARATAVVLLVLVLALNALSAMGARKLMGPEGETDG